MANVNGTAPELGTRCLALLPWLSLQTAAERCQLPAVPLNKVLTPSLIATA